MENSKLPILWMWPKRRIW